MSSSSFGRATEKQARGLFANGYTWCTREKQSFGGHHLARQSGEAESFSISTRGDTAGLLNEEFRTIFEWLLQSEHRLSGVLTILPARRDQVDSFGTTGTAKRERQLAEHF